MPSGQRAATPPHPVAAGAPVHEPDAVSALRRRVLELERLSSLDRVTGLWSRVHFDRIVGREIAFSETQHSPLSLALIAPDWLDAPGPPPDSPAGQAVMRAITAQLCAVSRPTDIAFRWSAGEFALLAPATSAPAATALATRLGRSLARSTLPLIGRLSFSAGAGEHHAGESPEPWIGRVAASLAAARSMGGGRVITAPGGASELFSAERHDSVLRLVWSDELVSGNALIDTQHGALFDAANQLLAVLTDKRPNDPAVLEQIDCLISALAQHFADEEGVLEQVQYPERALHRRMHERLLASARRLRGSVQNGSGTPGQVAEFLAYEVVNRHILKHDREYFPYLAARE